MLPKSDQIVGNILHHPEGISGQKVLVKMLAIQGPRVFFRKKRRNNEGNIGKNLSRDILSFYSYRK